MTHPPEPQPLSAEEQIWFTLCEAVASTPDKSEVKRVVLVSKDELIKAAHGPISTLTAERDAAKREADVMQTERDTANDTLQSILNGHHDVDGLIAERDAALAQVGVLREACYRHEGTGPNGEEPDKLICRLCHAGFFMEGETPVHSPQCALSNLPAAAICQGINPETGRDYVDGVLATCPIRAAKMLKEPT